MFDEIPLHSSPLGRELGCVGARPPGTDDLSARIVRLPMYFDITEEEQDRVADVLAACCPAARRSRESDRAVRTVPG